MRRIRLTPSMGVSLAALILAASGGAYAAATGPSGTIMACVHHRGGALYIAGKCARHDERLSWSVTGPQGAHGSAGVGGAAGAQGAAGATGAQGATGAEGAPGQSAPTELQSGETIRGIVGGRFQNGANAVSPMAATASFPIPASVPLNNAHIVVAPTAPCNTGSTTNVIAPAGFVCIYPDILVSATDVSGNTGVTGTTTLGFQMEWATTLANEQSSVRAEWAYTAP